jgi:hypothetical protein
VSTIFAHAGEPFMLGMAAGFGTAVIIAWIIFGSGSSKR